MKRERIRNYRFFFHAQAWFLTSYEVTDDFDFGSVTMKLSLFCAFFFAVLFLSHDFVHVMSVKKARTKKIEQKKHVQHAHHWILNTQEPNRYQRFIRNWICEFFVSFHN